MYTEKTYTGALEPLDRTVKRKGIQKILPEKLIQIKFKINGNYNSSPGIELYNGEKERGKHMTADGRAECQRRGPAS